MLKLSYLGKGDLQPTVGSRLARRAERLQLFEAGDGVAVVVGAEEIVVLVTAGSAALGGRHIVTADPKKYQM